jgi:hypothetical protein
VNRILPKRLRQRLGPDLYERLREQVLRRDGGTRSNLEVHHKEFAAKVVMTQKRI